MAKFLDQSGLTYFINKLKDRFVTQSDYGLPIYYEETSDVDYGGASYTRTEVVPQQTVTMTTIDSHTAAYLSTDANVLEGGAEYIITINGVEWWYTCIDAWYGKILGDLGYLWGTNTEQPYPFLIQDDTAESHLILYTYDGLLNTNVTVKVEKLELVDEGTTLITKSITANGTFSASDDSADGYSEVTVNVPSSGGTYQSKTVTPTTSQQVIAPDTGYDALSQVTVNAMPAGSAGTPTAAKGSVSNHSVSVTPSVVNTSGYITGGTKTGSAVTVAASELVSGTLNITENGTADVTNYASVNVNVSGGTSKNVQTNQVTTRRNNTALGSINSLTCSKAGTYEVYWTCARSSTSSTWGSQLYINGTAYGTENTTWSNHIQNNHLTGVTIPANATVAVYGRSRSGYYIYAPELTIIQTA